MLHLLLGLTVHHHISRQDAEEPFVFLHLRQSIKSVVSQGHNASNQSVTTHRINLFANKK